MSKTDIILSGVGGQGILSIATVIGIAALKDNLYIKQSEVHGMSQRGGAVQSHLRISDKPIWSDLIPEGSASLILSVEPLEALRYLSFLHKEGWLISNNQPFINISGYPDIDKILDCFKEFPRHVLINADEIAKNQQVVKASNMVVLGAASPFMNLSEESLLYGISTLFNSKGEEVVLKNLTAFHAGKKYALAKRVST